MPLIANVVGAVALAVVGAFAVRGTIEWVASGERPARPLLVMTVTYGLVLLAFAAWTAISIITEGGPGSLREGS